MHGLRCQRKHMARERLKHFMYALRVGTRKYRCFFIEGRLMNSAFIQLKNGSIAGIIATVPMTAFMLLAGRALPGWQQYDLPPEGLIDELTERMDVKHRLNKSELVGLAGVAHFG